MDRLLLDFHLTRYTNGQTYGWMDRAYGCRIYDIRQYMWKKYCEWIGDLK
jgi:hypothetical protein